MIDTIDISIVRLLRSTDLSDKQKQAYAALLQRGEASVGEIAQLAQLKRPITYVVLDELVQKGYAQKKPVSGRKIYSATDPNRIVSDMKHQLKSFEEMLPFLRAMQHRAGKPYIQYFEGADGAAQAFAQIHRPKEARYMISLKATKSAIPKELERWQNLYFFGKSRPGGKHFVQGETSDEYVAALHDGGQDVRFVPDEYSFETDIALVDGSVYLAGFDEQIHITVIHSKAIYDVFSTVFDIMWTASATTE